MSDLSDAESDWFANCADGYGFGYTKEQALLEMFRHVRTVKHELTVTLVKHEGNVTVYGPESAQFHGEYEERPIEVTFDAQTANHLRRQADAMIEAEVALESAMEGD